MTNQGMKKRNKAEVNRISVRCMRIVVYFLVLLYCVLLLQPEFREHLPAVSIVIGSCIILSILAAFIVFFFKLYQYRGTKYFFISITSIISLILITEFNTFTYPMILVPIIIASLYMDRTFVLFSALISCVAILISSLFQIGCVEYVIHPIFTDYEDVVIRMSLPLILVVCFITTFTFFIVDRNSLMMDRYVDSAITMTENEKALIFAFSEISENKSKETGEHIKRVGEYMKVLGKASGFDDEYNEKLATAAMMHDIGKLMIPEDILDKPGKLTPEEYSVMKNHVLYGEALLKDCHGEIMRLASTLAKEHHEHWDGSGYLGMKGEEISYIARMMSVCDVFDALTADRSYKKGWTSEEAYQEIVFKSGSYFDPEMVELFTKHFDEFKEIKDQIPDSMTFAEQ